MATVTGASSSILFNNFQALHVVINAGEVQSQNGRHDFISQIFEKLNGGTQHTKREALYLSQCF